MSDLFNLLIPEERKDKSTGEIKTFWHRVGTAFPHRDGEGFNLVIPEGMAISGKLVMIPRKDREDATPDSAAAAEFNDQQG